MAGYSGTPLPQKLGIKEQFRVALFDLPAEVNAELKSALASCRVGKGGPSDFAMIFVKTASELKKASSVSTDLNENEVRRIGLEAGLVDVKVCAVNEIWSGLKFVIRLKDREKRS